MTKAYDRVLFWFRRDLRTEDNAGLYYALISAREVHCVFVFDTAILDALPGRHDRRVDFIQGSVLELAESLARLGGGLTVLHAHSREAIPRLAAKLRVDAVFANDDYEPDARDRDAAVESALACAGRRFHRAKDTVIFEKSEVLASSGTPFVMYTPYKRAWLAKVDAFCLKSYPVARHASALAAPDARATPVPSLESLRFEPTNLRSLGILPGSSGARAAWNDFRKRMANYAKARDFPGVEGVSYLSVHNRFGTISIRELARAAHSEAGEGARTWLSEIIWREFFFQVLWHHPHAATGAFRREFDAIEWPGGPGLLASWKRARTGYPLVDAAMRQIRQTGYMHNRLRMVVASFLTKDLLVDWREGERYFAENLNDFDLAANNGGWQWSASTGCDAQPWFRIFNPVTQSQRFDPRGAFIRRYVTELARVPEAFIHEPWTMSPAEQAAAGCRIGVDYPAPVVDHAVQRERALALYKAVRLR